MRNVKTPRSDDALCMLLLVSKKIVLNKTLLFNFYKNLHHQIYSLWKIQGKYDIDEPSICDIKLIFFF